MCGNKMLGKKEIQNLLRLLFDGSDYAEMFSIIDADMIRKPAIRVRKVKDYQDKDQEVYTVEINWKLVNKFLGDNDA